MVLWVICGFLVIVFVASWAFCLSDRNFESWKIYILGKIALILLLVIFGVSKCMAFFVYNLEIQDVKIEQIARFNDGGKDKILAVVEIDGENLAFEISKNSDLEVGDTLEISKKSSKFPVYDNWSEDWKLQN